MQKWEYQSVQSDYMEEYGVGADLCRKLNEAGKSGWELVAITVSEAKVGFTKGRLHTAYLKRMIP